MWVTIALLLMASVWISGLAGVNILPRTSRLNGIFSFVSVSSWYETWHSYRPESLRLGFTIYKVCYSSFVDIVKYPVKIYLQCPIVAILAMNSSKPRVPCVPDDNNIKKYYLTSFYVFARIENFYKVSTNL